MPDHAVKTSGPLLLLSILLIAANMRATITGVGPLLGEIDADLSYPGALLGTLGSVPLVTWAVVSPLAHTLSTRWGTRRVVSWSLLLLGLGTAIRSAPEPEASLWIGAVLTGCAIAIANVLMPSVIKAAFPDRVPAVTAVFTAALSGFGALASGAVVPLARVPEASPLHWRGALLLTGILVLPALALWLAATRRQLDQRAATAPSARTPPPRSAAAPAPRRGTGIWSDPLAWRVAAYMGVQSAAFYMLLTWLASLSGAAGRTAVVAGIDVMVFQVVGIAGSFLVPVLLRSRVRRWAPALSPWIGIIGCLGLLLAPLAVVLWAVVTGFSAGASLSMALTLIAQRAGDASTASALSGMSQSVGYAIAALGPIAFGALVDATAGWTAPLLLLLATLIGQSLIGTSVGTDRVVLTRDRDHP